MYIANFRVTAKEKILNSVISMLLNAQLKPEKSDKEGKITIYVQRNRKKKIITAYNPIFQTMLKS